MAAILVGVDSEQQPVGLAGQARLLACDHNHVIVTLTGPELVTSLLF